MSLGPDDLVLCAGTVPRTSLAERVALAAKHGFGGISVFVDDYERARAEGWDDAGLRALLTDHGVSVGEVDPLLRWQSGAGSGLSAEGEGFFRYDEADFHRVAAALGARSINVVSVVDAPRESIAEGFAGLCDRAAEHGLLVHLEFLPWTHVPDAPAALAITQLADRPNGGILLDSWHHFRSGLSHAALRQVPGECILAVQLSDAPRRPEPELALETLKRRLLPGDGDADLSSLVRTLREIGCPAPLGVEVFSDTLAARPADETVQRAADATRALLTA